MAAALLLIIGCSFLAYHGVLENTFVSDSIAYLQGNPYIEDINLANIKWMLSAQYFSNWHPLTWLSFAIDYQLYGGLDAWGFHLTNLVLHAINSILLFFLILLFQSILSSKEVSSLCFRSDPRSIFAALSASVVFAVHPQHVESVAWVAERKDVLFFMFYISSIISYAFYATNYVRHRWVAYMLSLVFFVLSVASKPMAVTLPAVLLLVDIYPVGRLKLSAIKHSYATMFFRILVEKIPFIIVSAVVVALTINAQAGAMPTMVDVDIYGRTLNAFNSIFFYINKFVVPINLSPLYQHPFYDNNQIDLISYLPVIGLFSVFLVSAYLWRLGHKALLISVIFYLVTLSPVLGAIQVGIQAAADRYAYLPTIPLYMYMSAGIYLLIKEKSMPNKALVYIGVIALIGVLTVFTQNQVRKWKNPVTLWSHAVNVNPNYGFAHGNLASAFHKYGAYKMADQHYEYAYKQGELKADLLVSYILNSIYIENHKKVIELNLAAFVQYELLGRVSYEESCMFYNLGKANFMQGNHGEAIMWLSQIPEESDFASYAQQLISYMQKTDSQRSDWSSDPPYCNQAGFRFADDY